MNLEKSINLAQKLADASGEIICDYFRKPYLKSETKAEEISSIVTIADREAEEAMVKLLQKEASEDGIIREEGDNIPSQSGQYWVIDPIDGTSSFAKGLPIFGTLIALVAQNNTPLLGIVNQPILQERWLGIIEQPTLYNDRPLVNPYINDTESKLEEACLASTTPLMFITERQKAISQKLQTVCKRNTFGGDCYNYMALASGWSVMPMVILEADMKYYDFCALIPIIEGVGGVITDWLGNALNPHSTEVLAASNRSLLEQALAVIRNPI